MKDIKNRIFVYIIVGCLGMFTSCNYLDVVPDNVATIDNAFTSREMAEKFLFTCYSYMPAHASPFSQAYILGHEFWTYRPSDGSFYQPFEVMARGNQGIVSPALNYWEGLNNGKPMFIGLRDCNIFLERMNGVIPGLDEYEKARWVAEVKFLKAYYHYWLLRMYGPIPIIRENLPVSANVDEVQVKREPVDECFDYIVSLLDEAEADLPMQLDNMTTESGRATIPMTLALKAKVLVEAASPLFNGNTDYAGFIRKDGVQYFNQTYDQTKWEKAAEACRNAIDVCQQAGFELYEHKPFMGEKLAPETLTELSIRNSVTEESHLINREVIWNNPNSMSSPLNGGYCHPKVDGSISSVGIFTVRISVPMKIAETFYTSNGVPMEEDEEWETSGKYEERYTVKTATEADKYHIKTGYQTAGLHFDRETRFYANIGFDGGLWYGNGKFDSDDQWVVMAKLSQAGGKWLAHSFSITGYFCKKLVSYRNSFSETNYTSVHYPWPVIRLADLYLLCSEAANEAYGPTHEDATQWINLVRSRAGLEDVETSWANYAKTAFKNKPTTKEGLRDIIQQERLIELANEGHRYWEVRRWKRAREILNQPIQGWDIDQESTDGFYRVTTIFTPKFTTKDYFWPIRETEMTRNTNLDQNPGW
jgi:hypothetical protein